MGDKQMARPENSEQPQAGQSDRAVLPCHHCGRVLLEQEVLDDQGHWAVAPDKSLPLDNDNKKFFFACPHCGAKNFIAPAKNRFGVPQIKIGRCCPA